MAASEHLNQFNFPKMQRRAERLRLNDPECSYGLCKPAAADFQRLHGGEQVEFWGPKDLSDAHEEWQMSAEEDRQNIKYMGHTVNRVGDKIVDWTGSQFFGGKSPLPIVEDVTTYSKRFKEGPKKAEQREYVRGAYSRTRKER